MPTRPLSTHVLGPRLVASHHQLDNGLGVVLLPDRSAPVLSYQTWFRVGSRHERPGKTGLAHLFEHLMFGPTARRPAGEFDRLIEQAGGDSNAATWVDWTYYRDNVPASALPLVVELEADRMQGLLLDDDKVASEREVVANERRFRVDDDVDGFLGEELFRLAFRAHPYGWPTIGWMADILGTTTADAQAFYRTYYAPNNAILVLAGDFEPAAALALVERHYAGLAPASIPPPPAVVEPPQGDERRAVAAKPVAADRLTLGWRAPSHGDPDWMAVKFLEDLLLGGPSSRLHRRLVIETEAAAGVRGLTMPFRDPGLFEVSVTLKRGRRADEALEMIDQEAARLAREPVGDEELEKVRNRVETAFFSELENAEGKAEGLGHHEATLGDYRRLFEVPARMRAVGREELLRAAATYLVPTARTVVVAEPLANGEGEEGGGGDEEEGDDDGLGDGGEEVGR